MLLLLADSSIEGPPSFKPPKKYSDLSGFEVMFESVISFISMI